MGRCDRSGYSSTSDTEVPSNCLLSGSADDQVGQHRIQVRDVVRLDACCHPPSVLVLLEASNAVSCWMSVATRFLARLRYYELDEFHGLAEFVRLGRECGMKHDH